MKRGAVYLTLLFLFVLVRTAWLSDDALISLRTVLNVTHGFGLTFNIAERVQTFTHPLWLFLLTGTYWIAGNIYYATLLLSFTASAIVFWMAIRGAASTAQAWLAAGLLLFSRAFVDYSTSGLENPLSCLLVAASIAVFLRPRHDSRWLTTISLLASLLYLTRPDDVLVVAPMVVAGMLEVRRIGPILRALALGALPAIAWTAFAVIYYGFPFPNTAYAKLSTGISFGERWTQGVLYLIDSADRDPVTLLTMAVAAASATALRGRVAIAVTLGIALHLLYVVSIGGDFMSGRFVSVPFLAAVVLLSRLPAMPWRQWLPAYIAIGVAAIGGSQWPVRSDGREVPVEIRRNGIADERGVYSNTRSLLRASRRTFAEPDWPTADAEPRRIGVLDTCGLMGWAGIEYGPYTHLLDECALADPLLARLPAVWNESWRSGHFRRIIPKGYREGLESNSNQLSDPGLSVFYNDLRLITRSPNLLSSERLRVIGRMNRGAYDHLINWTFYRYGGEVTKLDALSVVKADGTPRDAPGNHAITTELAVLCDDRSGRRFLDVSVDSDDTYRVTFVKKNAVVSFVVVDPIPEHRRTPGLVSHTLEIPPRAQTEGFDTMVILPGGGDEKFGVGHLLLEGYAATDAELASRVSKRQGR